MNYPNFIHDACRSTVRGGHAAIVSLVAGVGLLLSFPSSSLAQIHFEAVPVLESPGFLYGPFALGDVNEDGKLDLVAPHLQPNRIDVRLGDGLGGFGDATGINLAVIPVHVILGEFTGDDHLDVSVVSGDDDAVVLLAGDGNGGFGSPSQMPVSGFPFYQEAADFNTDGNLDLAVLTLSTDTVLMFLGDGAGSFQLSSQLPVRPQALSLEVADFNLDGVPDLSVSLGGGLFDEITGGVAVLLSDGKGGLTQDFEVEVGTYLTGHAVGDFNEDGRPDVAVAEDGRVYILEGAPGNLVHTATRGLAGNGPIALRAVDVTRDGHLDLVVPIFSFDVGEYHRVITFVGEGDGSFPTTRESRADGGGMVTGDVNRDGDVDVVLGSFRGTLAAHLGNGNGEFMPTDFVDVSVQNESIVTADFNEDGFMDVATATFESVIDGISILLSDASGGFNPTPLASGPVIIFVGGKINADQHEDLLGIQSNGTVLVWLGNGDGSFNQRPPFLGAQFATSGILVDLDEDQNLDLVVGYYAAVGVFLGSGNGSFSGQTGFTAYEGECRVMTADFNEDGHADIGVASAGQGVSPPRFSVLYGDGTGDLTLPLFFKDIDLDPLMPVAGDFNNDTHVDVAIPHHEFGSGVTLVPGTGGFSLGDPVHLFVGSPRTAVNAADLDDDGNLDLLVTSEDTADVAVFPGDGSGTFGDRARYRVGINPRALAVVDLENDGDLDILTVDKGDESVSILRQVPPPHLACRAGNMNRGASGIAADVVLINGSAGAGDERVVELLQSEALRIDLVNPPSKAAGTSGYVLYLTVGEPGVDERLFLPRGTGVICINAPLTGGAVTRIANPIGHDPILGAENWPGPATQFAPTTLLDVPLVGRTVSFYVQGLMFDSSAPNGSIGVTNGVLVRVE